MNREELLAVRRLFDGRRLEQARELRGLLKSELAGELEVTAAAIGQFEAGVSRPSTATLASLSLKLGVPPAFFAAGRNRLDLDEGHVNFRSLRSTAKRDRTQARAQVAILAEIVGVLSRQVRLPEVDLPEYPQGSSPEAVAGDMRRRWGLGTERIANVVALLERHGVIVVRLEAATDDLDAFSCWIGDRPYVVLTSNKQAADRSRFDAAHELFHLVAHHDASPGDRRLEEEAHRFAAAFLMPESGIKDELPVRVDWRRFAELKLAWGVSMQALLYRARELGRLSQPAYQRAMMDMSRRGWRKAEPVDIGEPEQPQALRKALNLLETARGYAIDQLAADMALPTAALQPYRLTLMQSDVLEVRLP